MSWGTWVKIVFPLLVLVAGLCLAGALGLVPVEAGMIGGAIALVVLLVTGLVALEPPAESK